MAVKLKSMKVDLVRENAGDWEDSPDIPGVRFKVRSIFTPGYRTARDLLQQKFARQYRGDPVPPEKLAREIGTLVHEHLLLDWEGFDEPYSREGSLAVLTDQSYRDVISAIEHCATRVGQSKIEYVADLAKNSEKPSATA